MVSRCFPDALYKRHADRSLARIRGTNSSTRRLVDTAALRVLARATLWSVERGETVGSTVLFWEGKTLFTAQARRARLIL